MINQPKAAPPPSSDAPAKKGGGNAYILAVPGYGAAKEVGIVLLAFGLIAWLGGARFTVDGGVIGLNILFAWFGVPLVVPTLSGLTLIGCAVVIGFLCSRVEVVRFPIRVTRSKGKIALAFLGFAVLTAWLLISSIDMGTTYLGVTRVTAASWPIHQAIAASDGLAATVTVALTFLPEIAILAGLHFLGMRKWGVQEQ